MYSYLSPDKPNRARQPELDLAKFIAIILMIACHCGIYFFEQDTVPYLIFSMLGGEFAAPVFMVCMGIGVVFSHHNQPKLLVNRGISLMILGYVLNIIRATVPEIVALFVDPSTAIFGIPISFYMVDILQFAGFAMIFMGLLKKWKVEPFYQLLIGILMAGLGDILAEISTGYEWLDAICDLIWGANEWSFFPILNWFIYPAAGVFFGEILMHCNDKNALYKRLLPIGLCGVILSYYNIFTDPLGYYPHNGSYYFMSIENVVYGLCYPIFLFSLCYFITRKGKAGCGRFVNYSSTNLNNLYCISWVLILWIRYFAINMGGLEITALSFTVLTVAVFAGSYGLCQLWLKIKKQKKQTN